MKLKHVLLSAMIIALIFVLCACGGDKEPAETPEPSYAPPAVNTEAPDSPEESDAPSNGGTSDNGTSNNGGTPSSQLGQTADAGSEYLQKMVFIGDSTTYGLKAYNVLPASQVWTPTSGTLALFNQSIATILYPPTNTEVPITDAVGMAKPAYVVLTIGVNGVSMMDEDSFKSQYIDLVTRIQSVSPDTKIICNSIYPVEASYEAKGNGINNADIDRANGWIAEIAATTGTKYTDSASVLKGSDGKLIHEYGNGDGIHLCAAGFERVMNYLKTHAYI